MKSLIKSNNNYPTFRSLFDNFFNDGIFNDGFLQNKNVPSVNVKEEDDQFLIDVAAPGYKRDAFNIEIQNSYLIVSSKNKSSKDDKDDKYHRKEFSYSSFERSFYLPENLKSEDIKAEYSDGILHISIPKREKSEMKSRLIEIQ